jgi:hypothetical protein
MMHVAQAQTRTPDPWSLFGTDLEPAPLRGVADVDDAPREAPHARITLRTVDGDVAVTIAGAWIMLTFPVPRGDVHRLDDGRVQLGDRGRLRRRCRRGGSASAVPHPRPADGRIRGG